MIVAASDLFECQAKIELQQVLENERTQFKVALGEAESYFDKVRQHMMGQATPRQ